MMIDTHCHLCKEDYENVEEIISHMGDNLMIASGVNLKTNKEVVELCKKYSNVYGVIGIQPSEIKDFEEEWLSYIEQHLLDPKIVGIGEIGLDYHYGKDNQEQQISIFKKQLDLARKYKKPVVIHSRDAIEDTYSMLKEYSDLKMVMHCYSSSVEMARKFLELDMHFGIGGVVTFKNSKVLKEVVQEIPLERLLLETDSPYLTPEPYRGMKNEPRNILLVASKIAEIKNISLEEVLAVTTKSAVCKFDLKI